MVLQWFGGLLSATCHKLQLYRRGAKPRQVTHPSFKERTSSISMAFSCLLECDTHFSTTLLSTHMQNFNSKNSKYKTDSHSKRTLVEKGGGCTFIINVLINQLHSYHHHFPKWPSASQLYFILPPSKIIISIKIKQFQLLAISKFQSTSTFFSFSGQCLYHPFLFGSGNSVLLSFKKISSDSRARQPRQTQPPLFWVQAPRRCNSVTDLANLCWL